MCLETRLNLLDNDEGVKLVTCDSLEVNHWPRFCLRAMHLFPFLDAEVMRPTNISRFLESIITSRLPRREWELEMEFRINIKRTSANFFEMHSVEVIVRSKLIEELYSLMRCGGSTSNGRLTLKLKAELQARSSRALSYAFRIQNVELLPRIIDGKYNHGSYKCIEWAPEIDPSFKQIDLEKITSWTLQVVELEGFITDPDCQFTSDGILAYSKKVNNAFLENGMRPDMHILLDNGGCIPCHRSILAAKSPVIQTALESQANAPGPFKGQFKILDRTKDEVMAFLSYLYQEHGTEKALEDPSMALILLEMAHRYGVPQLEVKMTEILKNISVDRFTYDAGRVLSYFAADTDIINDIGLEEKGWVAQKLWLEKKTSEVYAYIRAEKGKDMEHCDKLMRGLQNSSAPVG